MSAIEQLRGYKRLVARINLLEKTPIGNGMYLFGGNDDDKLQDLHKQLHGLPSYLYLTPHEQELEQIANAYLSRYPAGTRAQLAAVPRSGADAEDDKLLQELRRKIQKVIEARGGNPDDFEAVLERISEKQELEQQKERIDQALAALEDYKPEYAKLLRLRYVEGRTPNETARELGVAERTFRNWRIKAIAEYEIVAV